MMLASVARLCYAPNCSRALPGLFLSHESASARCCAHRALQLRGFSQSCVVNSGHNKWSKIKQKKGVNDRAKSSIYAKAAKDIVVAIRTGGTADPSVNVTLANVLRKVKSQGVPKENIEKAISRATGGGGKDASTDVMYEAMVTGNVAVIIECVTDNGNRTIKQLRQILNSYSGRFAPVKFLFEKIGRVQVVVSESPAESGSTLSRDDRIERLWEAAVSAGGEDFELLEDSDIVEFTCPPESLEAVTEVVTQTGLCDEVASSEWIYRARDGSEVDDETLGKVSELVEELEENEDCVRVWTTVDSRLAE